MSFIVMQNPERTTHSCRALCACQAEFYIPLKNLPPSTLLLRLLLSLPPPLPFQCNSSRLLQQGAVWHPHRSLALALDCWLPETPVSVCVCVCVCKTDLERASETFFLVFVCGSSSAKPCQLRCGRNAHSYFSKRTFPKERTVFLNFWAEAPDMEGAKPCLASAGKQEDKRTSQTYSQ